MDNNKYTKLIEILLEVSHLSTPEKLPDKFHPFCKTIWRAFNLGREHERLVDDSPKKVCDVCGLKWISKSKNNG